MRRTKKRAGRPPRPLLARFRVLCDREGPAYYTVKIFRDRPAMLEYLRERYADQHSVGFFDDTQAITMSHRRQRLVRGKWRELPDQGEIVFHYRSVTAGIVSHEFTHAALYYCERAVRKSKRRFRPTESKAHDEMLAWCQGFMVSWCWKKVWKLRDQGRFRGLR